MTNFELIPDRSPEIILGTLRRKAPEFLKSDEYLGLSGPGKDLTGLPGLVCGAFTTFVCAKLERQEEADKYFEIIEEWASSRDSNVENYLITEVFENVRLPKVGEARFKSELGPVSLQLYERWMEDPPEDRLSAR